MCVSVYIINNNSSTQHSKALHCWGVRRRGEIGKHGKIEVKRKWWGLAQPPYSAQGNGRQLPRVETTGIDHLKGRITLGAGIVKGLEYKQYPGRILSCSSVSVKAFRKVAAAYSFSNKPHSQEQHFIHKTIKKL